MKILKPPAGGFSFYLRQMKDNFSRQADVYAKYRPGYPEELLEFILSKPRQKETAWDCATGNGQTAKDLARHFKKVFATDISQKQLDNAAKAPNIFYSCKPAEQTSFEDNSFDLITVSQALHWLKFDRFYTEVKRVAKPGAWLAAWMYSLPVISPEIDEMIKTGFYKNVMGDYWDYERKYVDDNYTTIPFPFEEIECPAFHIVLNWTLNDLEGYLRSWSALQKFISANGYDPLDEFMKQLLPVWGQEPMKIDFPVSMRMGSIHK